MNEPQRHSPWAGRIPKTPEEFGQGLKTWRYPNGPRRRKQLHDLAYDQALAPHDAYLSKETLQRYEAGQELPPLVMARHLDHLYGGRGWIELAVRSLAATDWRPGENDFSPASRGHNGIWPADCDDPVWVYLKPRFRNVGQAKDIYLYAQWGAYTRPILIRDATSAGIVLVTGKGRDDVKDGDDNGPAKPFHLTSNHPVFVLFGAGEPPAGSNCHNIREGWKIVHEFQDRIEKGKFWFELEKE